MTDGFIPPHGGYANLLSYRKAEIVYDATVRFCDRFLDRFDRTCDRQKKGNRRWTPTRREWTRMKTAFKSSIILHQQSIQSLALSTAGTLQYGLSSPPHPCGRRTAFCLV
jgi:hypothetical protein